MERFVKGDVVVIPFPFSDLTGVKRRPALVVANLEGNDLILCQITSQMVSTDKYSILLSKTDFEEGSLEVKSQIKPNKIFTAEHSLIIYKVGRLNKEKTDEVSRKLCDIISR